MSVRQVDDDVIKMLVASFQKPAEQFTMTIQNAGVNKVSEMVIAELKALKEMMPEAPTAAEEFNKSIGDVKVAKENIEIAKAARLLGDSLRELRKELKPNQASTADNSDLFKRAKLRDTEKHFKAALEAVKVVGKAAELSKQDDGMKPEDKEL